MADAERIYTHNGVTGTAKELCEYYNVSIVTFQMRRRRGATIEQAIPLKRPSIVYVCKGNIGTAKQLCKLYDVKAYLFMRRVHRGMSPEEAIEELLKNKVSGGKHSGT